MFLVYILFSTQIVIDRALYKFCILLLLLLKNRVSGMFPLACLPYRTGRV